MTRSHAATVRGWYASSAQFEGSPLLGPVVFLIPVIFGLWLLAKPGGETTLLWFEDLALFGGALLGAAACFLAAARYRKASVGRAWLLIGIGMLANTFAEGAWGFQQLILGQDPGVPAVPDIGYLAFYPFVFLGILSMPQAPVSGVRRVKLALDVAVAVGAVSLASFHFVISDLVTDLSLAGSIALAYPLADLAVIAAAIFILARGGRTITNGNLGILTLGILATAVSDTAYAYLVEVNAYDSWSYIDLGWMISYALIAYAGLRAASRSLDLDTFKDNDRPSFWRALVMNAAIVPVAALMFVDTSGATVRVDLVVMAGFLALVGVALSRHLLTNFEVVSLNRQLSAVAASLERRVQAERIMSLQNRPAPTAPVERPKPEVIDTPIERPEFGR